MNDAGVILMMVVDFDGVVVVELDDDFDELPQADNARAAAATVAIATTLFFLEWLLFKAPNCGLFTSVSCRMAVAIASVPGPRRLYALAGNRRFRVRHRSRRAGSPI